MKKATRSVARRYARALLDVALEKGAAEALGPALGGAATLLAGQADLRATLAHPALSVEKKKKVATAVWTAESPLLLRLITLLIERDRILLLPLVHDAYVELWNAHRGVVAAEAVSATPLDATQQAAIAKAASRMAGREVQLTTAIDPALLGGVVLRMDGRTYDGSIRAQLRALKTRLAPGAGTPTQA